MQTERPIDLQKEIDAVANALRRDGHHILAHQLRLAYRWPQNKAVRQIVAENVERATAFPCGE